MIIVFYTKIHLLIRLMNSEAERKTIHHKSLTEVKTQLSWTRSHVRPKCMWVWQDVELNSLWLGRARLKHLWVWQYAKFNSLGLSYALGPNTCGFDKIRLGYMLGPNACGFSKMSNQTPLGSVSWAWLLVRPKRLWVW